MKEFENTTSFSTKVHEMKSDELVNLLNDHKAKLEKLTNKPVFKDTKKSYEEYMLITPSVRKQYEELTKKLQIARQLSMYYDRIDENLYELYILGMATYYYVGTEKEREQAHDKVNLIANEREILERDYPALKSRYGQPKIPATVGTVFTSLTRKINIIEEELKTRKNSNTIKK